MSRHLHAVPDLPSLTEFSPAALAPFYAEMVRQLAVAFGLAGDDQ